MARMIEGFEPNTSSAKSAAQVVSAVKAAVKSTAQEVRKGIVGNTVTTNYPIGERGSHALGGSPTTGKEADSVDKALSDLGYGSGSGFGSGFAAGVSDEDPYQALIRMIQDTTRANNEWSAAQAQKQMDFQREMSSTAHQREVLDLQKAGLNPVLSAGGSGASTPTGAMGDTDTSGTRVIADVAMEAIAAMANTASGVAGVAGRAVGKDDDSFFGKLSNFYSSNKLGKKLIDTGLSVVTGLGSAAGKYGLIKAILR